MRLHLLAAATVCCAVAVCAQKSKELNEVVVTSRRPMTEIGVTKTSIDSTALKENIALSMADILTFNSSAFVKSPGRASLSTVAFRGTSPSHTQVTWNGMRINNPMIGMTDFSTIPAYFIDRAALYHGSSSVNETGGGLGGLVKLGTAPDGPEGFRLQYVQGIGSFSTFDEFLRFSWSNRNWTTSTRFVCSSSPNDYTYINHDKKLNIYDENHNIIGQYHPKEKNKSGAYRDIHALQEVYYDTRHGDRFGLNVWFIDSDRELPLLTTDYSDASSFINKQKERTLRSILSWTHRARLWNLTVRGGYIYSQTAYDYKRDVGGSGGMATMTRSRSYTNTFYLQGEGSYFTPDRKWMFNATLSAYEQMVKSADKKVLMHDNGMSRVGYDKHRLELSGTASAKWQPIDRLGMSLVLRGERFGNSWAPVIPALFIDGVLLPSVNLVAKASMSRNYRFPSLNDLYFMPGGNPDLRSEHGFTYDAGLSADTHIGSFMTIGGGVTWFDSYINDWILWLPTTRGFFSPRNAKKVHSYGIEVKASAGFDLGRGWLLDLNGNYSWTPSINRGEPVSSSDKSVGKQLPYVPEHSASITGNLSWRRFSFLYKWAYYSRRYTMSSNEETLTGRLPEYFMSNVTFGYSIPTRPLNIDLKLAVNNLLNEDYLSVLSRPMPGINFEFFISLTPNF